MNPRLVFHIQLADGARRSACCAHCGLLALGAHKDSRQAMTTDFLHGSLLNAAQAWYVLESSVSPCCRPPRLRLAVRPMPNALPLPSGDRFMIFTRRSPNSPTGCT